VMQIEIEAVSPDAPPLVDRRSKYAAIFERVEELAISQRIRARLSSKAAAESARTSVLHFATRKKMRVTVSILGSQIEVTRLPLKGADEGEKR
jgi:hypothetical protein